MDKDVYGGPMGFWVGLDGIERPDGDPDSGLLSGPVRRQLFSLTFAP